MSRSRYHEYVRPLALLRSDLASQHQAAAAAQEMLQALATPPAPTAPARSKPAIELRPLSFSDRSGNEFRPATFSQMVGQQRLKALFARIVANVKATGRPLDHVLLVGASGTGKTTFAQVVAHELGRRVFQVKAPISHELLGALRRACRDGDVVIIDEIHQMVSGDRRGITQAADPEDLYQIMEDRRMSTAQGVVRFPSVSFFGCTTDEGLLPEALLNRFPLRPYLDPYTQQEMATLAAANAVSLGLGITPAAALMLGRACLDNPRRLNTFLRNAAQLGASTVTEGLAREVICDLNGCTLDGLTGDMQRTLQFLYRSRRESRTGQVVHQASVNSIATALGRSRDTKSVSLFIEPTLIARGLVGVTAGGRTLTQAGILRALALQQEVGRQ